jgi:hypothetical protein
MVERTLFKIWCQKIKNENIRSKILILLSVSQLFFIGENLLKKKITIFLYMVKVGSQKYERLLKNSFVCFIYDHTLD